MNKRIINNNSISKAACTCHFSPFETKLKATLLNCEVAFVISGESITILPKLIISNLKQRLTIEPIETTKSACNDLTVLSCDLHNLLKVVSVSGNTILVNKSI